MVLNLNFVTIAFWIEHENCWSKLTTEHNVIIRTIIAKPKRNPDFIFGMDEIKVERLENFKSFLKAFKREKTVLELLGISEVNKRKGIYRVTFKEKYDNMIMSTLNNYLVFYMKDLVMDGVERFIVVLPRDEADLLKKDLERIGDIKYFKVKPAKLEELQISPFDLTDREREVIYNAINKGFYEIPRKIGLEDLAYSMGITKPTMEEYLRKAENKVMKRMYKEVEEFTDLLWSYDKPRTDLP
ncbi:helix-turn-helix domain-containing protein [Candidatus Acidianus copahuensis]|uniref:helix-turn-helix domain-containing protein n=1 Tax=Candidatus Acidianus copahuensis TaxID=1160895 RepID=UPI00064E79C9|nr:helix-turn-helix domain-containing protein [Candidatus Acidianus copahuensis]